MSMSSVAQALRAVIVAPFARRVEEPWEPRGRASALGLAGRVALAGVVGGGGLWLVYERAARTYPFHWSVLWEYRWPFVQALAVTLEVSAVTLACATVLGVLVGLARVSRRVILNDLALVYVETFRNVPPLIVIMLVYYGVGAIVPMQRFPAAVIALSAFEASFVAEIVRAGIQSVSRGQSMAGRSLGLSAGQTMWYIVLPQAVRRIIPPLAGVFVTIIKDSSLVSTISLVDITLTGKQVMSTTMAALESMVFIAAFYLVICLALSLVTRLLERRLPIRD